MFLEEPALKAYLDVLEPVEKMVKIMQGEKIPTAGKVLPHLAHLWLHFKAQQQNDHWRYYLGKAAAECFIKKVANLDEQCHWEGPIFGKFNRKWIICSAYLDPISFGQIEAISELVPRLSMLPALTRHLISQELAIMAPNQPAQQIEIGNNAGLFQIRLQHRTGASEMTDYERVPMEMIDRNPLVFWQKNGDRFPHLAKLARRFLAAPASSAPSERAFKELKCVLGDFTRNRLQPGRTAAQIFMRSQYLNKI